MPLTYGILHLSSSSPLLLLLLLLQLLFYQGGFLFILYVSLSVREQNYSKSCSYILVIQ